MAGPLRHVRNVMKPAGFHGHGRTDGFFEGWYVKLVSADRSVRLAVIPGVFLAPRPQGRRQDRRRSAGPGAPPEGAHEAFVQVLDGATGRSWYHRFDLADFEARADVFDVRVGPNHFDAEGVTLDLPGLLTGRVRFDGPLDPWPVTAASPGVMGWYAWMPFMECYHGVVSFGHDLRGTLELDGARLDLDGGRGYIEKDWGEAFPSGYVWMHSNSFTHPGTSVMASIALIPWLRSEFRGFLVGIRHEGRLLRLATYTSARTTSFDIDDEHVRWSLADRSGSRVDLVAERAGGALLHAPIRTEMHKRVEETLDGRIHLRVTDRHGCVVLDDTGVAAGVEVHGDLPRLLATEGR